VKIYCCDIEKELLKMLDFLSKIKAKKTGTTEHNFTRTQTGVVPRVVVVGAGFGGLNVARELAGTEAEVLMVDKNNYHGFWPLLYQVATAGLEPESIAYPVRGILRNFKNIRFQMAEITGINLDEKELNVKGTSESIKYDYLVLAAGSTSNFFGNQSLEQNSKGLKDINEAISLRNKVLEAFEQAVREKERTRRKAMLTFVIVGAGPTGVELAGAFAELFRHVMRKDYPMLDLSEASIMLVEAGNKVLASFPEVLQQKATHQLETLGVEVRCNTVVTSVENGAVHFKDNTTIKAETVIWTAGVRGATLGEMLGVKLERGFRVPVEPTLNLPGHPEVFVIGDLAHLEWERNKGKTAQAYPMVAPVAMQQGVRAARNILSQIRGREMKPFKYKDKGSMATIGRRAAVMDIWGIRLTGYIAWVVWLFVHLMYLVGFRNRLVVFTNWAYNYFTYDRAARLIR
jgi:NADH dehydrogenase